MTISGPIPGHSIRSNVPVCWLAIFGVMENGDPVPPCAGRLIRAHLIPKQLICRAGGDPWDRRSWVHACGGVAGALGHSQLYEAGRLVLRRDGFPSQFRQFLDELGLSLESAS